MIKKSYKVGIAVGAIVFTAVIFLVLNRKTMTSVSIIESSGVKDAHQWNSKPLEVKDINLAKELFDLPDGYVRAWDIGTYRDGDGGTSELDGARMLLVALHDPSHQGPFGTEPKGACDSVARIFIITYPSGQSSMRYDERYSPNSILYQGFHFIATDYAPTSPKARFGYSPGSVAFIPSLEFPGFVKHGKDTFVRADSNFPCNVIDAQGETHLFFDDIKGSLKPKFNDPVLGTAYEDTSQEGNIVFRASDGTYIRYRSR